MTAQGSSLTCPSADYPSSSAKWRMLENDAAHDDSGSKRNVYKNTATCCSTVNINMRKKELDNRTYVREVLNPREAHERMRCGAARAFNELRDLRDNRRETLVQGEARKGFLSRLWFWHVPIELSFASRLAVTHASTRPIRIWVEQFSRAAFDSNRALDGQCCMVQCGHIYEGSRRHLFKVSALHDPVRGALFGRPFWQSQSEVASRPWPGPEVAAAARFEVPGDSCNLYEHRTSWSWSGVFPLPIAGHLA
eukprot:5226105-Amphidinium_carterae.1